MLHCYTSSSHAVRPIELPAKLPRDLVWVDILNGTDAEVAAVEKATGRRVPSLASLKEIEHSSRVRRDGEAIVLSLPLPHAATQGLSLVPVGFVLTRDLLITVRFDAEATFDDFARTLEAEKPVAGGAPAILIGLLEAIVDAMADRLEEKGDALDVLAGEVLGRAPMDTRHRSPKIKNIALRRIMRQVGASGQVLGKLRASLLIAGRIAPYLETEGKDWLSGDTPARLKTLKADIASLDEYVAHLSDKVQFLLDAALGLINMAQNDAFKVLTIASVVGIPPTLVASMYGMNFHNMPELSWAWGYPYGLTLIALSAAIPLIWFKVKGWF